MGAVRDSFVLFLLDFFFHKQKFVTKQKFSANKKWIRMHVEEQQINTNTHAYVQCTLCVYKRQQSFAMDSRSSVYNPLTEQHNTTHHKTKQNKTRKKSSYYSTTFFSSSYSSYYSFIRSV